MEAYEINTFAAPPEGDTYARLQSEGDGYEVLPETVSNRNTHDPQGYLNPTGPGQIVPSVYCQMPEQGVIDQCNVSIQSDNATVEVDVEGVSPITIYATSKKDNAEPTIDHNTTGEHPNQSPSTEYYTTFNPDNSQADGRSPTLEYGIALKVYPEPTIDHSTIIGHQPNQSPTTYYFPTKGNQPPKPQAWKKSKETEYNTPIQNNRNQDSEYSDTMVVLEEVESTRIWGNFGKNPQLQNQAAGCCYETEMKMWNLC